MKHYFLTGEPGIGKSTAIKRFFDLSGVSCDGFFTLWTSRTGDRTLKMYAADSSVPEAEWKSVDIAVFNNGEFTIYGELFDSFGADVIKTAGRKRVIVMDEVGRMEKNSPRFIDSIFEKLDGNIPVVGVLKLMETKLFDDISNHPNTEIIPVTLDNRDDIPRYLISQLQTVIGI